MDTCDATTLPVPSCSLDSREHQITELAAHIHAANYRLLCLIAEFDRREGWFQWGILYLRPLAQLEVRHRPGRRP